MKPTRCNPEHVRHAGNFIGCRSEPIAVEPKFAVAVVSPATQGTVRNDRARKIKADAQINIDGSAAFAIRIHVADLWTCTCLNQRYRAVTTPIATRSRPVSGALNTTRCRITDQLCIWITTVATARTAAAANCAGPSARAAVTHRLTFSQRAAQTRDCQVARLTLPVAHSIAANRVYAVSRLAFVVERARFAIVLWRAQHCGSSRCAARSLIRAAGRRAARRASVRLRRRCPRTNTTCDSARLTLLRYPLWIRPPLHPCPL